MMKLDIILQILAPTRPSPIKAVCFQLLDGILGLYSLACYVYIWNLDLERV